MLKNSKLLKGITLAFALVLILGCGLLLDRSVSAESNKVVLFVSDHGDNTTGQDEATAFTSIDSAITASNAMKHEPGTELVLIVVDRVTVTTQKVDSVIAKDKDGGRMLVTITSLNPSSEADFSSLILAYHNTSGTKDSRYHSFYNDLNFLNIKIEARVFETRVGNSPTGKRFHANVVNFLGVKTTFDHSIMDFEKNDFASSELDYLYTYFDYGGNNANVYMDKVVNFKNNCKFGSVVVLHYYRVRNIGVTYNFENVTFGTIHVNRMANTETTDDLKYLRINLGNGTTIGNLYLVSADGNHGFTEGMTINYYPGCHITGLVAGTSNTKGILGGGITHNVYGGTFDGSFTGGTNGPINGDITNNIYGGTFNSYFGGGGGNNNSAKTKVSGTITNNVYAGNFKKSFYGAGSYTDEKSAYKATFNKVVNNITGGVFESTYVGGSDGPGSIESIENNVTGINFPGVAYGGSINGCNIGTLVTNFHDVSVGAEFYAGTQKSSTIENMTNNISGNGTYTGRSYFGSFGNGTTVGDVTGTLTNNIYGGHFKSSVYLASRNATVNGKVVNNIYDGTFGSTVYGGMRAPSATSYVTDITNNIYGGDFKSNFAGGNAESGEVRGTIVNNVYGGTIASRFIGGNYATAGNVYGEIINNIYAGTFKGKFVAAAGATSTVEGTVTSNIYGGTFAADILAQNDHDVACNGTVNLNFEPTGEYAVLTVLGKTDKAAAKLVGTGNAILIGKNTSFTFGAVEGKTPFSQTEEWVDGQTYATVSAPVATDAISAINASSAVAGSATFDGSALKGSDNTSANAAPSLSGLVSFHLNENLGVRFWIDKAEVENYITANGKWNYTVLFDGKEVANVTFTAADQLPAADIREAAGTQYFTFLAGLDISATDFDKSIEIVLGGMNTTTYTVYELLENGVANTSSDAELCELLKAIHNYGVEAANAFKGTNKATLYPVSVSGTYRAGADYTKTYGYAFYGYTLSMDEQVSLNYYLQAAADVDFDVVLAGTDIALDPSKVTVKKVEGNENYNYVVSIKLTVPEMANDYTVIATNQGYTRATGTTSVTRACASYMEGDYGFADAAQALLAYVEASQNLLNR